MKQQIRTPCGKPIRYAWKTPHKFLEKFSKNLYGTTGGTYSLPFLRPVMIKFKKSTRETKFAVINPFKLLSVATSTDFLM